MSNRMEELIAEFSKSFSREMAENLAREQYAMESGEAIERPDIAPATERRGITVRQYLEDKFITGAYDIEIDPIEADEACGLVLTPQNIKSALKRHAGPGKTIRTSTSDEGMIRIWIDSKESSGRTKRKVSREVLADRQRIIAALDFIAQGSKPHERVFALCAKIIVNNGGEA